MTEATPVVPPLVPQESFFQKLKVFATVVKMKIDAFLTANPVVKNWILGLLHVAVGAAMGYVSPFLIPGASHSAFAIGGMLYAVAGAIAAYAQNTHDKASLLVKSELVKLQALFLAQGVATPVAIPSSDTK